MEHERFVWFIPLGGVGEELLDLFRRHRYTVYRNYIDPAYVLIYYRTPEGRWIDYNGDGEYDTEAGGDGEGVFCERYAECHPEEVAHYLLHRQAYGDRLPEILEKYRQYGDMEVFVEWYGENHDGRVPRPLFARPRWDGKVLTLGNKVCHKFTRSISNQTRLLDAFESKNWERSIKDPFSNMSRLRDTIKTMNRWENPPIRFRHSGRAARWLSLPENSNSSNSH